MKINYKKITAIGASLLMAGMTAAVGMAANFPAPFVSNGVADVAVVYGTGQGVSSLDMVQAGNIQTTLGESMPATGGSTTITGDVVALDTSNTRIWLNSSLNVAKTTLTSTDLPIVLADSTFSGNVDATLTQTIKLISGDAAGGEHSSKVWFGKQPTSSDEPVLGISLGSSTYPLYNSTVTMKAVDFSHSDSEGETIHLFGKEFVVSTATDADSLVLFSSAEEVTLSAGGTGASSSTVTVGGTTYVIELISGSDTTATISVNGESKEVTEGNSKKIAGLEVAVKSVDESTALNTVTCTLLVGSEKITFEEASTVMVGADNDPIEGTKAYMAGGVGAMTSLTVEVFKPSDPDEDTILAGTPFVDPVFESFKFDFQGINIPLDDSSRELIKINPSGDDVMQITLADDGGNEGTLEFGYNNSGTFNLSDQSGHKILVREMANASYLDYVMLGVDDYGHLVQVTTITNSSSGSSTYASDSIKVKDVLSGVTYEAVLTAEGTGTVTIEGKSYTVTYGVLSGEDGWVQFKYPTADSLATSGMVIFPTIETSSGAKVAFVEPVQVNLGAFDGTNAVTKIYFPDGDRFATGITIAATAAQNGADGWNWTVNGVTLGNDTSLDIVNVTVGDVSYFVKKVGTKLDNKTLIGVKNITGNSNFVGNAVAPAGADARPGILMFEEKDDDNNYKVVYVDMEQGSAGNSNNGVGVNDVYFSAKGSKAYYSATSYADSDIEYELDWWGTMTTSDGSDSDQKSIEISYPKTQVYSDIYVGEQDATVSSGSSLGDVLVKDSEVDSVKTKNLIIVGGSCINSAAATVLGSNYCGPSFTTSTSVGAGQFLIQSFADKFTTGKIALLVAGYEAADTVNAGTYLRTQTVDTTAGKKYIGTSQNSAELVVA